MNNSIISSLLIITFAGLLVSVLFYRLSFSNRTLFKGRMRLLQFLLGLVMPPLILLPIFQIYRVLEGAPFFPLIPLSDDGFLFVIFLLIVWSSVGNGMHVAGVSIDYKAQNLDELDEDERALILAIDFFHHSFSHFLVNLPILIMTFIFSLFEINHHGSVFMNSGQIFLLIVTGCLFGLIYGLSVVEGGGWYTVMPLQVLFILVIPAIFGYFNLPIFLAPVSFFFWVSYIFGFTFLLFWGTYHRGFPEIMGELKLKDGHPRHPRARNGLDSGDEGRL